jgi:Fur family ferric uptake transcriptional regulator/Fur family peroxide stress response transcriptional regulator
MNTKRNTVQRSLVLNAVKELNTHATAEQVYDYVARLHPSISKATVYRNLNQMAEAGELLNIGNFYGSALYDHHCHPHYHFICKHCKKVYNVDAEFNDIVKEVDETHAFTIHDVHMYFSGICPECDK